MVWRILQTYTKPQIFSSCVNESSSGRRHTSRERVERAPWSLWTEAQFRSLTEQAKAAEYHGNVKVLHKLTREAAGQPRIKPIPSITMENNITMTMGRCRPTNDGGSSCEVAPRSCCDACRPSYTLNQRSVQDHACRTSAFPNERCAQQSRARKMARVQVSRTSLWSSSKLVETRWFPSSKAAFPFGFKALGCAHFGRARMIHAVVRTIVASRSAT